VGRARTGCRAKRGASGETCVRPPGDTSDRSAARLARLRQASRLLCNAGMRLLHAIAIGAVVSMVSQAHAGSNPLGNGGNGGPQLGFELVLDGLPGQGKTATISVEAWSWGASATNEREDMFEPRKPGTK